MSIKPVGPQLSTPVGDPDAVPSLYADGRTKQAFKNDSDINKILQKAQRAGTLSHLVRHGATYGDFSDVPDLLTAHSRLQKAERIYQELPSEVRREFSNKFDFFAYVNDPANAGKLEEVLPELAKPGMQRPDVRRSAASEVNPAIHTPEAGGPPVEAPSAPQAASEPPSAAE